MTNIIVLEILRNGVTSCVFTYDSLLVSYKEETHAFELPVTILQNNLLNSKELPPFTRKKHIKK